MDSFGSLGRHQLQEALRTDPFVATLGSVQTRIEVEADGALDGALVIVGVEARREVAGADEAAEAAGVQVGELPDQALRAREPLLHRRPLSSQPCVAHRRTWLCSLQGATGRKEVGFIASPWLHR